MKAFPFTDYSAMFVLLSNHIQCVKFNLEASITVIRLFVSDLTLCYASMVNFCSTRWESKLQDWNLWLSFTEVVPFQLYFLFYVIRNAKKLVFKSVTMEPKFASPIYRFESSADDVQVHLDFDSFLN